MLLIGEKCNGAIAKVGEAIRSHDGDEILRRVKAQADAGAQYIDLCAAVAPDGEVSVLRWMIELAQSVTDIPLCIDSPNPEAILSVLPYCKRPGIINSVSLCGNKAELLFPAVAGTEWKLIALLLDDAGIPKTAEARLNIFRSLLERAEKAGVAAEQLFFDPLVVTRSTCPDTLETFLTCCRVIRAECPDAHITSGLSNISFGLPARKYLNGAFLVLALQAGMDSAILDPTDDALMGLLSATEALIGKDESCLAYIAAMGDTKAAPAQAKKAADDMALQAVFTAVEHGNAAGISALVQQALDAGIPAAAVLSDGMVCAMNRLGERFSAGDAFVPELMLAARAMKSGVAVLQPLLADKDKKQRGTVVIGTVAGDLHDIGKNLVATMLESAGFDVLDLGVDVSPEAFCAAAQAESVRIVALSALITTSLPAMQATVEALKRLPCKNRFSVFVGGAPVSFDFAKRIGADVYTPDAAVAAKTAKELVDRL